MKKKITELVFILDKSGSMAGLERDTIGGFNSMLEKQKKVDNEAYITTVLFDNYYELLHDRINILAVKPINESNYQTGGSTALLDAIGRTVMKINNAQKNTSLEYRAENVMFVIITDGEENSSCEFSSEKVKSLIKKQTNENGWEFIFLGANIDAVETASTFGIAPNRAQNYHSDSKGTALNFGAISETMSFYRKNASVPKDWNSKISADFESRK